MLKAIAFVTASAAFLSILTGCAETSEVRLISPIGAAARSIVPGWGQIYTHSRLEGAIILLSVGILVSGGLRANDTYLNFYNDKYSPAVLADSNQADFYFDRSNQYYKLSRFLLYTAAGIWAYSIMDAYVGAHIYNAKQQVRMLDIDDKRLRQLKPKAESGKVGASFLLPLSSRTSLAFPSKEGDRRDCLYYLSSFQYWYKR